MILCSIKKSIEVRHRIPETNVATLSRSCSLVSAVISSSSASMLPRMTTENILELPEILGTVQSRGWRPTAETLDRGSPGRERCKLDTPTRSGAFIRCNLLVGCYLTHTARESSEGGNFYDNCGFIFFRIN